MRMQTSHHDGGLTYKSMYSHCVRVSIRYTLHNSSAIGVVGKHATMIGRWAPIGRWLTSQASA